MKHEEMDGMVFVHRGVALMWLPVDVLQAVEFSLQMARVGPWRVEVTVVPVLAEPPELLLPTVQLGHYFGLAWGVQLGLSAGGTVANLHKLQNKLQENRKVLG